MAAITITRRPDGLTSTTGYLRPPPGCAPWLEVIWYSEGPLDALHERVLPAATSDLIINLGAPMWLRGDTSRDRIPTASISGLLLQPLLIEHPPIHRAIGLRMRPAGLRALLDAPASVALDATLALDDLIGHAAADLIAQLQETSDPAVALQAVMRWAVAREPRTTANPCALWTAQQLERTHGAAQIADLQHQSGWGTTRFIAAFREEYGITPKHYARLTRLRRTLELLTPRASLASIAAAAGFTDQPHMNAELQRLTHHTPSQIIASRYPAGLTLAE